MNVDQAAKGEEATTIGLARNTANSATRGQGAVRSQGQESGVSGFATRGAIHVCKAEGGLATSGGVGSRRPTGFTAGNR